MPVKKARSQNTRIKISEKNKDFEVSDRGKYPHKFRVVDAANLDTLSPCNVWWPYDAVHYSYDDVSGVVDDDALDHFIHRIIYAATTNDNDDTFEIDDGQTKSIQITKHAPRMENDSKEHYERRNRKQKSRNKKKMRVKPNICDAAIPESPQPQNKEPFIRMPIRIYRKLVKVEIDAKIREMYEYFDTQNTRIQELKDRLRLMDQSLATACFTISSIHEDCQQLRQQMTSQTERKWPHRPNRNNRRKH